MSSTLTPNVIWAQRKDKLYITVELADTKNSKITLEPAGKLHFEGESSGKHYKVDLELLKEIDVEKSKYTVQPRNVQFLIEKKEQGPFWERLLKNPGKLWFLKADWNRWKDEDEGDDDFDTSNFDGIPGMGDMGDMGFGDDEEGGEHDHHDHDHDHDHPHDHHDGDSDDEGLPDLEPTGDKKVDDDEEEKKRVVD